MMEEVRDQGGELLEEWDWETARPTGRSVARGEAHRRGIAHEGVHLWVVRTGGDVPEVLFQRRAHIKEMYPDCLDITVGGHVPFGVRENKIQKEAMEEIGIAPADSELIELGYFRYEEIDGALFHREFQRVYLYADERPLDGYRFTDGEVDGIYAVKLSDLERMMREEHRFMVDGFDGRRMVSLRAGRKDFHPLLFAQPMEEYMHVVLFAVKQLHQTGSVSARMPSPVR